MRLAGVSAYGLPHRRISLPPCSNGPDRGPSEGTPFAVDTPAARMAGLLALVLESARLERKERRRLPTSFRYHAGPRRTALWTTRHPHERLASLGIERGNTG